MKIMDLEFVEAPKEFKKLPPDGYVCKITDVEDNPSSEKLNITYEIAEGPWKNYYSDDWGKRNKWAHTHSQSYKDGYAIGYFKKMLEAIEASNDGFTIADWQKRSDENELKDLKVGIIFQEREYIGNDGKDRVALDAAMFVPVEDIRNGNFEKLERKKLDRSANDDFMPF